MDTYNNWRWTMWVVLIISAPAFAAALCMKETSRSTILLKRQKKGLYEDSLTHRPKTSEKIKVSVTRTLHMMVTEPLVLALAIYTGFAFSVILSFFASYPIVFGTVYGFDAKQSSLAFLSLTIGFIIASITFEIMNKTLYKNASKTASGLPAPEHRLYAALIASIVLPISLFWYTVPPIIPSNPTNTTQVRLYRQQEIPLDYPSNVRPHILMERTKYLRTSLPHSHLPNNLPKS